LPPDVSDISEELLLGRALIEQGHLGTAQRVLVKLCQQHPDNAEAFGGLGDALRRKGDESRARIIGEYAEDLRASDAAGARTPLSGAWTGAARSSKLPVAPQAATEAAADAGSVAS
jgi:thioredoxin-like negative regulator of GroEL